ncbi:MAG: MFS transporter [Chloroflexi bacterium]|nr:MFS transporter [Chloroflexota bacterium]MCI0729327.1 MFS transporter [Chloroflexota bacterium]
MRTLPVSLSPAGRGSLYYLGFWGSIGVFAPFINVHFAQLGLNGRQIGLLAALTPLMTLLWAMPLSALTDRQRSRVPVLRGLIAGFALTFFLIGLARTFAALALLMTLLALFLSPIIPIADSLIARMSARHGLHYGSMRLWGSFGFATIAIACGALWQRLGFDPMFVLGSLMLLPVTWLAGFLEEGPAVASHDRPPLTALGRDRGLLIILGTSFLIGLSLGLAIVFEGIYMDYLGGSKLLLGLLPGLAALSELPTMHYSGLMARRLGNIRTLLLAFALLGTAFLGYALAGTQEVLLIFAVIRGLGFGLFYVTTVRLVTERTPEAWSSTTQAALIAGAFGLAPLIAGPIGGAIYDALGPTAVFAAGSAAVALAALLLVSAAARGIID